MPNWSNLNNSASNFNEQLNYQLCEKKVIKSLRITNPNPTTTAVESNFDDFYTTGLMILEIAQSIFAKTN